MLILWYWLFIIWWIHCDLLNLSSFPFINVSWYTVYNKVFNFLENYTVFYCIPGKSLTRKLKLDSLVNCLWFAKLTPSKLILTINNLLVQLFILQTFYLKRVTFELNFYKISYLRSLYLVILTFHNRNQFHFSSTSLPSYVGIPHGSMFVELL